MEWNGMEWNGERKLNDSRCVYDMSDGCSCFKSRETHFNQFTLQVEHYLFLSIHISLTSSFISLLPFLSFQQTFYN